MTFGDRLFGKKGRLVHDSSLCNYCGLCGKRCPHKALKVNTEQKSWKIRGICMRCGRCIRECPQGALSLQKQGECMGKKGREDCVQVSQDKKK